ncbi:MAG TPA: serine hydrolase domain-containing protein [Nocardioidaceae bacterium]|nr:serine hydrolase domain-containing protein [Nocardioidaceae bacterium]
MTSTMPDPIELQRRLDELAVKHGVPGATAGVLSGDELEVVATGVTRLGSQNPVTPDTLFLIASITKVWTATLVMGLVDEGRVDVDAPVTDYLDPPLRLGDSQVAKTVTVGQLLCHTGGFFGDADEPSGREDDAVRRTVDSYDSLAQLHRPGALFSYSNAGFNVLGRVVECVTDSTWDDALRTRLIESLGLEHTSTLPEETMTRLHAVGHEPSGPDTLELEPVTPWLDPRGSGPCGGTLATTAGDLLAFARLHLRDGFAPSGKRLLEAATARAMREPRIAQPDPSTSPAWGWGWGIERIDAPLVVEHGGNTCGQESLLVVVPERDLAVCALTNGDAQGLLRDQFAAGVLEDLVGISRPRLPDPVDDDIDTAPYIGSYRRSEELTIEVTAGESGLEAAFVTGGKIAERVPSFTTPMTYAGGTTFRVTIPPMTEPIAATFVYEGEATGPATHLALGLRVAPRV